jgi:predicted P-loop ATPase
MRKAAIFSGINSSFHGQSFRKSHPVQKRIDTHQLQAERDQIWAAAVALYRQGQRWWLTDEEEAIASHQRQEYETHDPWEDEVSHYIEGKDQVSIAEILDKALGMEKSKYNSSSQTRIRNILKRLKWSPEKNPRWHQGKRQRLWAPDF